ncbi:type IV pilus twitching motility protein PilT [Halanaerobium sp. Z-7514]|uniref:Type IV pilus twitching motility protein PilT n=1 Tax=Halanaerobium polyolivorans TaxID=2886943 RepID=A0AAW4WT80_9FIRM|nr:type IV pilus twitching motility protein PilT [Halanaerobium polyolivorans]MCC3143720.1 type IV pilus twitching motility protein PilT [Halanaerobium polyolivorans]
MEIIDVMKEISKEPAISDLHLTGKTKPIIRNNGKLEYYEDYPEKLEVNEVKEIAKDFMNQREWEIFLDKGEVDFSYSVPGYCRYRVNAYKQRGSVSLALRIIPQRIPTIDELGLPQILKKLAMQRKGLILCTGPTGSGKSTTLASMINVINKNKPSHIITLEDPIEYLHSHNKSIIHQREVGFDTTSFADGLRAALRQDPDVILVGEMRDLETINIALEASETGHLVLATLHTNDAPSTVERIIDVFPAHQQQQVRIQLASSISGIISQQLLPSADNKSRVAALEILIATSAVRNIIREGKTHQLVSAMQTGGKYGMVMMNNYLVDLYKEGKIAYDEAVRRSDDPEYVKKKISGER